MILKTCKKVNEQYLQMEHIVRTLFTVSEKEGKYFVIAKIPRVNLVGRPVFLI